MIELSRVLKDLSSLRADWNKAEIERVIEHPDEDFSAIGYREDNRGNLWAAYSLRRDHYNDNPKMVRVDSIVWEGKIGEHVLQIRAEKRVKFNFLPSREGIISEHNGGERLTLFFRGIPPNKGKEHEITGACTIDPELFVDDPILHWEDEFLLSNIF